MSLPLRFYSGEGPPAFLLRAVKFVAFMVVYVVVGTLLGALIGAAGGMSLAHFSPGTVIPNHNDFLPSLKLPQNDIVLGGLFGGLMGFGIAPYILLWKVFSRFMDRERGETSEDPDTNSN